MEKGLWMEHLFVDPRYMKQGIGSALVSHVREFCLSDSVGRLMVFVDPNAAGFYVKTGAVFVRMSKSSIPGRDIPVYAYEWKTHDPDY
jgi:GNAT superfamily N-acetyltransferase